MDSLNENDFISVKDGNENLIVLKRDYERLKEALTTEQYVLVLKFSKKYGDSFLLSHVEDKLQSVSVHQKEEYEEEVKKLDDKYNEYLRIVVRK